VPTEAATIAGSGVDLRQTQGVSPSAPVPDGTYDAMVVDVREQEDGSVAVDLTIIAGPAKGDVVTLRAPTLDGDPLELLGIPATIVVSGGEPAVTLEP
jgi:hypothetical protein